MEGVKLKDLKSYMHSFHKQCKYNYSTMLDKVAST